MQMACIVYCVCKNNRVYNKLVLQR